MKKTHLIIHELQCKGWFSYSSTSNHYHFVDNGWLLRLWHLGGDIFWLLRSKSQAAAHDKTNQLSVIIQCNPALTKILKRGASVWLNNDTISLYVIVHALWLRFHKYPWPYNVYEILSNIMMTTQHTWGHSLLSFLCYATALLPTTILLPCINISAKY